MSLFKAREWWSTVSGYEEFHSTGSLTIVPISSDEQDQNIIMVGSFSGILRAYAPTNEPFSPSHLLLETQLPSPIIQVGVVKLLRDSPSSQLAVLHLKLLAIYSLSLEGEQLSITPVCQFSLTHTSHGMVIGQLGRADGQELICVQSLDGQLRVFGHTGEILTCSLPGFLLPGPLAYVSRTNIILTANTDRSLEAYRYQVLNSGTQQTTIKKAKPDWTLQLGEPVVDIKTIDVEDGPSIIIVLGERNLYCLKDSGRMLFSKKLETPVTCVLPYMAKPSIEGGNPSISYILVGHSQQLQVLCNQVMVWSAQLPHVPVAIAIAQFQELEGVIVTLDEIGHLQCSYLGTDPTSLVPSLAVTEPGDLQKLSEELKEIQSLINEADKGGVLGSDENTLIIDPVEYSKPRPFQSDEGEENENQQSVEAKMNLYCSDPLASVSSITLLVEATPPISVHPSTLSFDSIGGGYKEPVTLTFACNGDLWYKSRQVHLIVSYCTSGGHTHTINHTLSLPMELFCKPSTPQDGQYKVTLESTNSCVPLMKLYSINEEDAHHNAVAFEMLTGQVVTMISSKTSHRYRLQSNYFQALGLFVEDFVARLQEYHKEFDDFKISMSPPLPLPEYFNLIEQHFKVRLGLQQCQELIGRHARQFRAIQKRLLARFKDKTPSGLVHLDTLLDGTFMQLMALTEKCEELQVEEEKTLRWLTSGSHLIILLLKLSADLSDNEVIILENVLNPNIPQNTDQGWEEIVDASITQLLKTSLAKTNKDQAVTLPGLDPPSDCQKIKRHIALLCDRLLKGGKLETTTQSLPTQATLSPPKTRGHRHLSPLLEEESEQ